MEKQKSFFTAIIGIVILAALVGAGLGTGYFLMLRRPPQLAQVAPRLISPIPSPRSSPAAEVSWGEFLPLRFLQAAVQFLNR